MTCEGLASYDDGWMDGWMKGWVDGWLNGHSFQTDLFRMKTQLQATANCQICQ